MTSFKKIVGKKRGSNIAEVEMEGVAGRERPVAQKTTSFQLSLGAVCPKPPAISPMLPILSEFLELSRLKVNNQSIS